MSARTTTWSLVQSKNRFFLPPLGNAFENFDNPGLIEKAFMNLTTG